MVRYMNLEEQVDRDFTHARRRAFLRRIRARLRNDLACNRLHRSRLPPKRRAPPVSLYKAGDKYLVVDGNRRVSVASYQNVEPIDADVIEIRSRMPIGQMLERACKEA